jgi:hypothetical protein
VAQDNQVSVLGPISLARKGLGRKTNNLRTTL